MAVPVRARTGIHVHRDARYGSAGSGIGCPRRGNRRVARNVRRAHRRHAVNVHRHLENVAARRTVLGAAVRRLCQTHRRSHRNHNAYRRAAEGRSGPRHPDAVDAGRSRARQGLYVQRQRGGLGRGRDRHSRLRAAVDHGRPRGGSADHNSRVRRGLGRFERAGRRLRRGRPLGQVGRRGRRHGDPHAYGPDTPRVRAESAGKCRTSSRRGRRASLGRDHTGEGVRLGLGHRGQRAYRGAQPLPQCRKRPFFRGR